ncbi:hypothetical protein OG599_20040 [Streptomyces sp. NBC_01335]|uniref:hypothetical protein n=1 Tax=Streptomyces sp. NBC_01335 TaxID=2903828 RepID=UPI002E143B6B|nr:hypothetical protein OG599_20040 [Streptomyces sp. NBC_01335]
MTAQFSADGGGIGTAVARRLVLADAAHQYTLAPVADAPVLVVELAPEEGAGTRASEYLRRKDTVARAIAVVDAEGGASDLAVPAEPLAAWAGTGLDEAFVDHLRTALPSTGRAQEAGSVDAALAALGPLMLLRTHAGEPQAHTEVLMCTRIRTIGAVFVRVARFDHAADAGVAELFASAFKYRTELEDFVRVEGNAYLGYEKDIEIEEKVTLVDDAAIWPLTKSLWTAVEKGDFPGFFTDPGYELSRWHFVQYNFEVLAPDDEVGHYAFQSRADGTYRLKMKKFAKDSLRRIETFRNGLEISGEDFEGYLAREFPELSFRRLPGLRRTKFDINVQSATTGHCFGIETDEITLSDGSGRKMRQVETEYLETRRHFGMDGTSIDSELSRLTSLVEAHLADLGIAASRGLYSKLSFLRDSSRSAEL